MLDAGLPEQLRLPKLRLLLQVAQPRLKLDRVVLLLHRLKQRLRVNCATPNTARLRPVLRHVMTYHRRGSFHPESVSNESAIGL